MYLGAKKMRHFCLKIKHTIKEAFRKKMPRVLFDSDIPVIARSVAPWQSRHEIICLDCFAPWRA